MTHSCMGKRRKPKSKDYEHKVETGCYLACGAYLGSQTCTARL